MLVSSIVGFNFGNKQVSAQNNQQQVQSQNNMNSCSCPKGRKHTHHAKEQHNNKLSLIA